MTSAPPVRADQYTPGQFARSFDLNGRVAVITGGGGGLGRAIAAGMADFGARVVVADRDLATAEATAAMCVRAGESPLVRQVDVTDSENVRSVFAEIEATTGGIDILLNSVGINIRRPAAEYTVDEWHKIINTNLSGTFFAIQAAVPGMLKRGYGRILSIGSVSSLLGHPFHAPYAATKGGIAIMTKAMATEWAPLGVTINALGPAYTETPLTAGILADPEHRAELTATIPMGRLGRPEDLVGAAIFLCSESASFVTGQTLYIDGGRTSD